MGSVISRLERMSPSNTSLAFIEEIARVSLHVYKLGASKGVRGGSSDNAVIGARLARRFSVTLTGRWRRRTPWVYGQVAAGAPASSSVAQ